jgi:hypothetical protein
MDVWVYTPEFVYVLPFHVYESQATIVLEDPELTIIVTDCVPEHPDVSVPVTTYVVVTEGVAKTEAPMPEVNPVTGDHA